MTNKIGGWVGKVLWINLSTGATHTEDTAQYADYIGGMGIGYKILWDHHQDGQKATDPDNIIVFAAGPLTGSGAICTGRTNITSRTPTIEGHLVSDGHMGGHFAPEMKYAGYDAIAVVGKAEQPVWIKIVDNRVSIEPAPFWGQGTYDSHAAVAKLMGQEAQVVAIGQAGENLVPMSCILTPGGHSAGGHGAVMGAKNLKAIGVIGTGEVPIIASRDEMRALDDHILGTIGSNNNHVVPSTPQSWSEYHNKSSRWKARPGLKWGAADEPVELGEVPWNERNRIGYRCSMAEMYVGVEYTNKWLKRMSGCHACPIRCYCELKVPQLKNKFKFKTEYVANTCMGFLNGHYLMGTKKGSEENAYVSTVGCHLLDDYAIFSGYGLISHLFKFLAQHDMFRALLPAEEYASIDWQQYQSQDATFLIDLYRRIAFREGELGYWLGACPGEMIKHWRLDGTNPALNNWDIYKEHAVHLFNRKMNHALHHASETAGQVGTLINTIFNRDPCCHSHINIVNTGLPHDMIAEICAEKFGEGAFDKVQWYTPINQGKVNFAKWSVVKNVLHDSLTVCNWVFPLMSSPDKKRHYRGDTGIEAQMFSLVTGKQTSEQQLDFMAERLVHLHRALTILEMNTMDMRNDHDELSDWVYDIDPDKQFGDQGTIKMDREDIQDALDMFYDSFGWDVVTGAPLRKTLEKFGLGFVADRLASKGLLPA